MKEEREMGIKLSRWTDFRVNLQTNTTMPNELGYFHHQITNSGISSTNNPQVDEYQVSRVHATDGTEYGFSVGGNTVSGDYGILFEYDQQADTHTGDGSIAPETLPYSGHKADVQFQEAVDMVENADNPPYDADRFDG